MDFLRRMISPPCVGLLPMLLGLTACAPSTRPNVVLISIDTLRADHLGCYGAQDAETPAIDGLARRGVLFRRAYSPLPLTLPSHATMLTGLEPIAHGLVDNGMTAGELGGPTLAERLTNAGYDTAAFVASFVLNRVFGLDRGFALYDDGPPDETELRGLFQATADARERVDSVLAWLARRRDRPFFLFLHFYDVHAPHVAPEPFQHRFAARPYDGEVAYVDSQVRRLLDDLEARGLESTTLVVLTSDHGEGLGDHGEGTHGIFLYDSTLHVPLILHLPGRLPGGRVIEDPVTLADVTPTILALLALEPDTGSHGRALFPAGSGGERVLWAQSDYPSRQYGWARLRSVRRGRWKYIDAPRSELYDIARDPRETSDVATAQPEVTRQMASIVASTEAGLSRIRSGGAPKEPDEDTRARLAALGYVSTARTAASGAATGPLIDPKDGFGRLYGLDAATEALARGGPHLYRAEALFRRLATELPLQGNVRLGLGRTLERLGRFEEAERVYHEAAALDGARVQALARLAALAARRGDHEAEVAAASRLVETAPRHAASRRLLGEALESAGRPAEAEAAYRESLRLDPAARSPRASWYRFLMAQGRREEAEGVRRALLKDKAQDGASLAVEALGLQAEGRLVEALARFDAAAAARRDDPRLLTDRGFARLEAGNIPAARADFEAALSLWPGYERAKGGLARLSRPLAARLVGGGSSLSSARSPASP